MKTMVCLSLPSTDEMYVRTALVSLAYGVSEKTGS